MFERFCLGRDEGQQRIIYDLRWKARGAAVCAKKDDMISLKSFRGMDGLVVDREVRETTL
jgi:hypothetical protein